MEQDLRRLVEALAEALGDRLASVVLYGSHATDHPHPRDRVRLCIELDPCDAETLSAAGRVLAGPVRLGRVQPYVVARGELGRLADVFPLRIRAMRAHHRVLRGADPLEGVRVGRERLRTAVEQGLRNHLVRLRTQVMLHGDDALGAHQVLLGIAEGIGEEVLGLATLGVDADPAVPTRLEALRDGAGADEALLADTLGWLSATVDRVDRMEDA